MFCQAFFNDSQLLISLYDIFIFEELLVVRIHLCKFINEKRAQFIDIVVVELLFGHLRKVEIVHHVFKLNQTLDFQVLGLIFINSFVFLLKLIYFNFYRVKDIIELIILKQDISQLLSLCFPQPFIIYKHVRDMEQLNVNLDLCEIRQSSFPLFKV